jgi:hypothetical protein
MFSSLTIFVTAFIYLFQGGLFLFLVDATRFLIRQQQIEDQLDRYLSMKVYLLELD